MEKKTLKTATKISVKIWRPIIDKLDGKMDAACLRRDAYLIRVLEVELDHLDREVSIPNSPASYKYVFDRLDQLDRKLVSLALPAPLIARINEICARKRIVRDAFFNRLFFLLAASSKAIDRFLFQDAADEWRRMVWSENKNDGPFFQNGFSPLEPDIDPFWAIREGLEMYTDNTELEDYIEPVSGASIRVRRHLTGAVMPVDSVYSTVFDKEVRGRSLLGLSCYLPDWLVPGDDAQLKYQATLDELYASLEAL